MLIPTQPLKALAILVLSANFLLCASSAAQADTALAMHGAPKYAQDFQHFDYVNPKAPKGGTLNLGVIGSFNSLNPFLIKGVPAKGLRLVYQSLLSRSRDEPFTLYANLAQAFEIAPDRRWITFTIDERARFSNGKPVTIDDVYFSFETLRTKGRPNHRNYYNQVAKAEKLNGNQIRFTFKGEKIWELPLIIGLMPIFSADFFDKIPFSETSLVPPIGSGPYLVEAIDPGRQIQYRRNPEFWGADLPHNRGRYNIDLISYDYFRDRDIALEAFKSGQLDVWFETDPGQWKELQALATENANLNSHIVPMKIPAPMLSVAFNTRRPLFSDPKIREALITAFDFYWINKSLFHGLYQRTRSYFQSSELAATGLPSPQEIALLKPFSKDLDPRLFTQAYQLPESDGSGRDRTLLRLAKQKFKEAGFGYQDGLMINPDTKQPVSIEILVKAAEEIRLLSSYQKSLKRLGIDLRLRLMDSAGYQNRLNQYDYDMVVTDWGQSLSPGNEQEFYWSKNAAKTEGTRNYPGIESDAVDHLINIIRDARDRETLVHATRALDRVLLWGQYGIPLYHVNEQWLVTSPTVRLPTQPSFWGTRRDLWWQAAY
ncbi:extracellular solute-binding protein [Sneathiella sp.]|jgi:peptide/nickel transport system substrate-binding protein|uniref:extracellular solute-binding protein n=1 Tax=Sneathiella sp. TaxID=1964365 RepID=UPI0039E55557